MLYLDSSALIKHYIQEAGTQALNAKLQREENAGRSPFTSVLAFAEIHRAFAQRSKDGSLTKSDYVVAREAFEADWLFGLTSIELASSVLAFIPDIVERFPLKSSDAVHLASALWMRDLFRLSGKQVPKGSKVAFATSDVALGKAALASGLELFNPQVQSLP